jgi:hypothetical protein
MSQPSAHDFLTRVFGPPGPAEHLGLAEIAGRVAFAGVLGGVVALVHGFSTRSRPRTPGLQGTLILLAMLIALVTLAIGDNAAKAFTLVGTLAIVRFRTAVRDIRDTAFVIFAVAVGIAVGAFNPANAVAGTLVVGAACVLLSLRPPASEPEALLAACAGRVLIRCDPVHAGRPNVDAVLQSFARFHQLVMSRDGRDGGLRLLYAVDVDRAQALDLVTALRDVEGVRRVTLSFGELDEED